MTNFVKSLPIPRFCYIILLGIIVTFMVCSCDSGNGLPRGWRTFSAGRDSYFKATDKLFQSEPNALVCLVKGDGYAYAQTPEIKDIKWDSSYVVEFSVYLENYDHQNLELFNNGPIVLFIEFRGQLKARSEKGAEPVAELAAGRWHAIKLQVQPTRKRYDVYVDDKPVNRFRLDDRRHNSNIRLGILPDSTQAHGAVYWDDLRITQNKVNITIF